MGICDSQRGDRLLVQALLEGGAQTDLTDLEARTALHFGAMHKHASVCEALLLADPTLCQAVDRDGRGAHHTAA